ncbi:MAG TPA: hypothetical protein VFQ45_11710 [Longimicrobium sp.]|nr:hypothetical protein [Longimicrobium sp.]
MRGILGIRRAVYGAAVAAALTFGASAAFARPAAPCNNPLASGSCRTLSECQTLCGRLGASPSASACRDRCCFCNVF